MNKDDVCIPLEQRIPNNVDMLLVEIEKIQKDCQHDFRLTKRTQLAESKIKNVHVAYQAEKHGECGPRSIILQCLKCNKIKGTSVCSTCPQCLAGMKMHKELELHEKYFGEPYESYTYVRLFSCEGCGFRVVEDKYDR